MNNAARKKRTSLSWPNGRRAALQSAPRGSLGILFWQRRSDPRCQNCFGREGQSRVATDVYLFGFSRGALLARKFAEWLELTDVPVKYLGIWDTVDSALKVDVGETCPACVAFARHAVARDERRRYFKLVPIVFSAAHASAAQGEERVFPGVHSDVGGLYDDNHDIADVTLSWIAEPAVARGLRLRPGATFRGDLDLAALPVHDSFRLVSNLWGLLGSSVRRFKEMS